MSSVAKLASMLNDPSFILSLVGYTAISSNTAQGLDPMASNQNERIQIHSIPFGQLAHADKFGGELISFAGNHSSYIDSENQELIEITDAVRVPLAETASLYLNGSSLACFPTVSMGAPTKRLQLIINGMADLSKDEKHEIFGVKDRRP